jgi:HEAT repeat protein
MGALIIVGGSSVVTKFTDDLNHEDTERQRLAVTALGWIGEVDVVEPLLSAINHSDPAIRRSAINSLARIKQVNNVEPIVIALNDENSAVRKAAVTALLEIQGEEAIDDVRILLDDTDVWVRYHTINAIGTHGCKHFAIYIMPCLDDGQDIIRIAAAKALSQIGGKDALPALLKLQKEKNLDVVDASTSALKVIEGQ